MMQVNVAIQWFLPTQVQVRAHSPESVTRPPWMLCWVNNLRKFVKPVPQWWSEQSGLTQQSYSCAPLNVDWIYEWMATFFNFQCYVHTLPMDQLFNLELQFESVFNLEFQPKFGIQHGIPIPIGLNLGECRWQHFWESVQKSSDFYLPIWKIPSGNVVKTKNRDTVTNMTVILVPPYLPSLLDSVLLIYFLWFAACFRRNIIMTLHIIIIIEGAKV